MAYGEVTAACEALDRLLQVRGMRRENYSIGVGAHKVHVYAKCAEREWGCAKPSQVDGVNVEWHWDVGPITAYSSGSTLMSGTLPKLALSVRQPWAWAIVFAGKDIENRSWQAVNHGLTRRGRIAIHAAKGMGKEEYEDARDFINEILAMNPDSGLRCPAAIDLTRGAIVGSVEVVDVVTDSNSQWFMGPRGLVLRNPEVWTPIPAVGQLGYFEWKQNLDLEPPAPARWMLPPAPKPIQQKLQIEPAPAADDLFTGTRG